MFAKLDVIALDCSDLDEMVRFYSALTGWQPRERRSEDWVQLVSDEGATLAFQLIANHQPPDWPEGERPQQLHLDFNVTDLVEGERLAVEAGAVKAEIQPMPEEFIVFFDPAGHPFCLVDERFA